jgi:Putative metal-binding motif
MLFTCSHCAGFVPANLATCPHCGTESLDVKTNSKLGSFVKGVASVATSGMVAVTLMACYGAPDIESDNDGDGYGAYTGDCDDYNGAIHPDAMDTAGDGIDQNCDGADGINPDAGAGGSGGSGNTECVTCGQAVATGGLVAPSLPFCTSAGQEAFDVLKTCVCSTTCPDTCTTNVCQGSMATTVCSECVQTSCNTQNLACSDN